MNEEFEIVGWRLRGAVTASDAQAALALVEPACQPSPPAVVAQALARCFAATRSRASEDADTEAALAVMMEELIEFPPDVVRHVLRGWARREKWRPSLAELRERCERESRARRSLCRALRAAAGADEGRAGERRG